MNLPMTGYTYIPVLPEQVQLVNTQVATILQDFTKAPVIGAGNFVEVKLVSDTELYMRIKDQQKGGFLDLVSPHEVPSSINRVGEEYRTVSSQEFAKSGEIYYDEIEELAKKKLNLQALQAGMALQIDNDRANIEAEMTMSVLENLHVLAVNTILKYAFGAIAGSIDFVSHSGIPFSINTGTITKARPLVSWDQAAATPILDMQEIEQDFMDTPANLGQSLQSGATLLSRKIWTYLAQNQEVKNITANYMSANNFSPALQEAFLNSGYINEFFGRPIISPISKYVDASGALQDWIDQDYVYSSAGISVDPAFTIFLSPGTTTIASSTSYSTTNDGTGFILGKYSSLNNPNPDLDSRAYAQFRLRGRIAIMKNPNKHVIKREVIF